MTEKEKTIDLIKKSFKIIKPWKQREYMTDPVYAMGWNNCINEMSKNMKDYIEKLEKL